MSLPLGLDMIFLLAGNCFGNFQRKKTAALCGGMERVMFKDIKKAAIAIAVILVANIAFASAAAVFAQKEEQKIASGEKSAMELSAAVGNSYRAEYRKGAF